MRRDFTGEKLDAVAADQRIDLLTLVHDLRQDAENAKDESPSINASRFKFAANSIERILAANQSTHPVSDGRECFCDDCKCDYEVWFAPNELWNAVMRPDGEVGGEPFLCASCFLIRANAAGIENTGFLVTVPVSDGVREAAERAEERLLGWLDEHNGDPADWVVREDLWPGVEDVYLDLAAALALPVRVQGKADDGFGWPSCGCKDGPAACCGDIYGSAALTGPARDRAVEKSEPSAAVAYMAVGTPLEAGNGMQTPIMDDREAYVASLAYAMGLAANPTDTPKGQWQAISSAPKDGTRILVCSENDPAADVWTTRWLDGNWYPDFPPTHWFASTAPFMPPGGLPHMNSTEPPTDTPDLSGGDE